MKISKILSLLLVLSASACEQGRSAPSAPTQRAAVPNVDRRDQYALLAELEALQTAPAERQSERYAELRRSWQGRRIGWEVRFVPELCRTAAHCLVVVFDHAKRQERIVQGWLPRLVLDATAHASLETACKPHQGCVVRIEAKLSRLSASPEVPTSLELGEVEVGEARAERPGESWGRARRAG